MNDKLKAVLDKIAKLRALAAGATTQAEAEAAAAQAAALITKYQIDEAQLEVADPTRQESIGEDAPLWTGRRLDGWLSVLGAGLCKIHGCYALKDSSSGAMTIRVAGRPSDVAIVRYLFTWLMMEILRLSRQESGRASQNAFRLGAANGVLDAMKKARLVEERAAPQGAGVALVLAGAGLTPRSALSSGGRFLLGSGK